MAHNFYCKDDDHVVAHSHVTGPNEECLEEEKYVDFYLCLHKLNVCEFHSLLQTINFSSLSATTRKTTCQLY